MRAYGISLQLFSTEKSAINDWRGYYIHLQMTPGVISIRRWTFEIVSTTMREMYDLQEAHERCVSMTRWFVRTRILQYLLMGLLLFTNGCGVCSRCSPLSGRNRNPSPLKEVNLGLILSTQKEDHCFMFGNLALSEEKSKEYLSGLGHDLAFSKDLSPAWPDWDYVHICAVYCLAGHEGSSRFIEMMREPEKVADCQTLDELLAKCNSVFLVNTGGSGEHNTEIISACLEAGRPTFVDKFLSPKLSETKKLLEMARERGVPLGSSSYIWTSQPGLDLKAKLRGKKLTRIISTGWGGNNIAADIHAIAQMFILSENRRPVSVRHEEKDGPKAIVTFDDGLVGELVPRRPTGIFELEAISEGITYSAIPYEGKHSRPSSMNLLKLWFGYLRGENKGIPMHLMEDAVAIWEAAGKARESGETILISDL
ncbi:MAG: hypothetical protein ABIH23_12255 [bacterium]